MLWILFEYYFVIRNFETFSVHSTSVNLIGRI